MAKTGAKSAGVDTRHDGRSDDAKARTAVSSLVSDTTCVAPSATPTPPHIL